MVETQEKAPRRALGRGLDSLLPGAPPAAPVSIPAPTEKAAAVLVPVDQIDRNPYQTRRKVDDEALSELVQSVALHGVLQPVMVRPIAGGRFQLIAGERRWLASRAAGRETIPAVIKNGSDGQALEWTIIENLQREDLDPIEQGRAFARLHDEFQLNHEEIAKRTGKDRSSVTNYMRLLRLPENAQQMLADGRLSMGHAKCLLALDPEVIAAAAERVAAQGLSVRKTEEFVHAILQPGTKKMKPEIPVDPNVREAERRLREVLQMKVSVEDRRGKGRVVIEYSGLADFDRLMATLENATR